MTKYTSGMRLVENAVPYTVFRDHSTSMNPRKIALTTPVIVITGMPATLKRAIGEFSKISFRRQGMMAAAMTVPRNVTAITAVAARKITWKLGRNDQMALTTSEGTIIRISEP